MKLLTIYDDDGRIIEMHECVSDDQVSDWLKLDRNKDRSYYVIESDD